MKPDTTRIAGSSYEHYDNTHKNYNKTRLAVGAEQVASFLLSQGKNPATFRLLDAGCGIGLHLAAFRNCGFQHLTGLDASTTGLQQATAALNAGEQIPPVRLICGDIRSMPFADASFDAVVFSFVLHHLPHADQADLANATFSVLQEAYRILAPGGQLAIITCNPEQLGPQGGSLWYYRYFPQAATKLQAKFLPPAQWQEVISKCAFKEYRQELIEKTYWTDLNLKPEGPFDINWRNGDSLFALCQPAELEQGLARLRHDLETGTALEHIARVKEEVEVTKQGLILTAGKP